MSEVLRLATIGIEGMTCSSCSGTVENALKAVKGVKSANVNLTTNTALVSYDSSVSSAKDLVDEIESVGFDAEILLDELAESSVNPMHSDKTGVSSENYLVLGIEGMTCSSCSGTVENALRSVDGVVVSSVVVALTTNTATLQYDPSKVNAQQIANEVEDVGFGAEILQDGPHQETQTEKTGSVSGLNHANNTSFRTEAGVLKTVLLLIEERPSGQTDGEGTNQTQNELHQHSTNGAHHRLSTEESEHGASLATTSSTRPRSLTDASDADTSITASLLATLTEEIASLNGVVSADLHVSEAQIKVTFDDFLTGPRDFSILCRQHHVHCTVSSLGGFMMANRLLKSQAKEAKKLFAQLMLASALTVPIFCITMIFGMIPFFQPFFAYELFPGLAVNGALLFLLSFPVQFYVGHQFHSKAYKTLKTGSLGMDFLVSTGTMAAYVYSTVGLVRGIVAGVPNMHDVEYFETSAVLITAVLLGKYLEVYAKGQTAAAIHKLSKLKAHSARLVKSGTGVNIPHSTDLTKEEEEGEEGEEGEEEEQVIDASLLHRRDAVRLVAGETVPADGVLLPGTRIGVDEAMMTGESALVSKNAGDKVFGGTMVVEGSAVMQVTACGDDSTLGRIITTVQAAQASKPPIQELADRVAKYFVPIITGISLCTFVTWSVSYAIGVVPKGWYAEAGGPYLFAFFFALAVWVSACPCAFGLATPTAVLVATGVAAKHGILIRKGAALQYASNVNVVAFDKTGTLTKGSTEVTDFLYCATPSSTTSIPATAISTSNIDSSATVDSLYDTFEPLFIPADSTDNIATATFGEARYLLQLMLLAECRSSHPLAKGITAFCKAQLASLDSVYTERSSSSSSNSGSILPAEEDLLFDVVPGLGIHMHTTDTATAPTTTTTTTTTINTTYVSTSVLVGSGKLLQSMHVPISPAAERTASSYRAGGKVAVFMAVNGRLRAIVGVSDAVRPEAAHVVRNLHSQGIACYMITGDEATTAHAIAQAVGIPPHRILARAKPEDKKSYIEYLQAAHRDGSSPTKLNVAFVGDGTNDSPALAVAQVGITMAGGSDIAVEAGDMVLCKNDLQALLVALDLSTQTMRRIQINYFWALGYNLLLVPVAAGALYPAYHFALAPMLAGMAMAASSVSIVLSSLLLVRYRPPLRLEERVATGSKAAAGSMQPLGVQCDCPASSAHELHIEPPSLLQRLLSFLFCRSPDRDGVTTAATSTVADVATLLSPAEWRRALEEGGDEGEFIGSASHAIEENDVNGDTSRGSNRLGARKLSFLSYVFSPFTATADAYGRDYVAVSTLSTEADDNGDCGDVELGDLTADGFVVKRNKKAKKNNQAGKAGASRAAGCGCGKGNCKCGVNCRCGEVTVMPTKLPRVR